MITHDRHVLRRRGPKRWPPGIFGNSCNCSCGTTPQRAVYYYYPGYVIPPVPVGCCTGSGLPQNLKVTFSSSGCAGFPLGTYNLTYSALKGKWTGGTGVYTWCFGTSPFNSTQCFFQVKCDNNTSDPCVNYPSFVGWCGNVTPSVGNCSPVNLQCSISWAVTSCGCTAGNFLNVTITE